MVVLKLSKYVLISLCLLGLAWQSYNISNAYFKYEWTTNVEIQHKEHIDSPAIITCFELNPRLLNVTVKTIFELTPSIDLITSMTLLRLSNGYEPLSSVEPSVHFDMYKFLKQHSVCYSYGLRNPPTYHASVLSNGIWEPVIFVILLNSDLMVSQNVSQFNTFYMQSTNARFFGNSKSFVKTGIDMKSNTNAVSLRYSHIEYHLLEYPYRSECISYDLRTQYESQGHCYDSCMSNSVIEQLNEVPFSVMTIDDQLDLRLVNGLDTNSTKREIYVRLVDDCERDCKRKDCELNSFVPEYMNNFVWNQVLVKMYIPNEPKLTVYLNPKMITIDYITYLLSCVSFWLGFSPLSFFSSSFIVRTCHRLCRHHHNDLDNGDYSGDHLDEHKLMNYATIFRNRQNLMTLQFDFVNRKLYLSNSDFILLKLSVVSNRRQRKAFTTTTNTIKPHF